jgi:hypothetical protein
MTERNKLLPKKSFMELATPAKAALGCTMKLYVIENAYYAF